LALTGVYELPKAAGSITASALVYWSGTQVTTVNTDALIGVAVAASSGSTVKVRLNGAFGD
jgi:predicted RecA/RadA family phage recombinase